MTKRRALVVDDDAAIRILVSRVMARHEYDVEAVRDGGEAIEKLLENDYDVVVLDLMMPRIDGFHVVKYFLEKQPSKLQNVIVMTAFGARAFEQVCPPIQRFIEKPFEIDRLLAEVMECVSAAAAAAAPDVEAPVDEGPEVNAS